MDDGNQLLIEVFKNAEMTCDILRKLIRGVKRGVLRECLTDRFAAFYQIADETKLIMLDDGERRRRCACFLDVPLASALSVNLKLCAAPACVAETLMHQSLISLIDTQRLLNQNITGDETVKRFAQKLIDAQIGNIRLMQRFL